jgi:hypothetical protein
MEPHRHSAPARHPGRTLFLVGLVGAAVGALAVAGTWWVIDAEVLTSHEGSNHKGSNGASNEASSDSTPADSTAPTRPSTRASTEARNQVAVPSPQPSVTASNDPVLLLGDSLAVGIEYYLDAGLGERTMTVDAAEGRGTATSVTLLSPYAKSSAPVWIVSLGTNDNPEDFESMARSIMELAGPERCVVWFDVWRADTDESINATLTEIAGDHSNLHLIPWYEVAALHPEWFSGTDVHPSTAGYAVRGQMAVDAVTQHCE